MNTDHMNLDLTSGGTTSRREILQLGGGLAASMMLGGLRIPSVYPGGSDVIQVALVGCGGRGSGAAEDAMSTSNLGPIKLVAMADAFEDRLNSSYDNLHNDIAAQMDVPPERRFVGWDAYRHAMDCLRPGDVVILTTPLAFRWVHFQYAISKKLNVFMEKPLTADGPTSKRMLKLAEDASSANLKVGVGLMSRHAHGLEELHDRIASGQIGDIVLMRGYRMHGPVADSQIGPKPSDISDLDYQVRHFHAFLWASGGCFNDFYIHHVDHLCWMKNAWPVSAQAVGGKHYKEDHDGTPFVDQNFDNYSVEYTFADGSKFYFDGRCMDGAAEIYSSYIHGTKGNAIAARANDCGGPSAIYAGQNSSGTPLWESKDNSNPYRNEWQTLITAVRQDKPYSEVKRGVEASLTSSMGRMAAHTGQVVTFDQMLNCPVEFAPGIDKLTRDTPAPLQAGTNSRYPIPQPGRLDASREY